MKLCKTKFNFSSNSAQVLFLLIILAIALVLRLYKINTPLADWHSWRQVDTASVTRIYAQQGLDLLHPRFYDLSNIPSGLDNPQGFRMVEFPIYNSIHLFLYKLGYFNLVVAGRLLSIIASLISIVFLYASVKQISGSLMGLLSSFIFATLPFNIYYNRTVLPDSLSMAFFLISFFIFLKFIQKNNLFQIVLSSIFFSLAMLTRPYIIFFSLPFIFLAWHKHKLKSFLNYRYYLFALIALLPFFLWRGYIQNFPSGIPATSWLYNLNGIRFRPAWFRWLFAERLSKLILGYFGIAPVIFGLLPRPRSKELTYYLWGLGILIYFVVFAGGNVTHDYYQAITIPFISIFLARGFIAISTLPKEYLSQKLGVLLSLVIFIFTLAFSYYQIKGYYQINRPQIVTAGKFVDKHTPKDAKVIANYNGDTAFLFQTNRFGWPMITNNIEYLISRGADYYLSVNFDNETNKLIADKRFSLIEKNSEFVLIKLSNSQ